MNCSESYSKWLETAYTLFAEEGPRNFSIKALANKCGLPRTNFYYYFDNKEELVEKVIELHFKTTTEIFNFELEKKLHLFIPDLYVVIYEFKLGIQFTKQLFLNREHPACNKAYMKSVQLSADLIVPKFMEFFKIELPHESVKALWYILTDTWYSRVDCNNFSVNSLCELCYEIMDSVMPLIQNNINKKETTHLPFDTPV